MYLYAPSLNKKSPRHSLPGQNPFTFTPETLFVSTFVILIAAKRPICLCICSVRQTCDGILDKKKPPEEGQSQVI